MIVLVGASASGKTETTKMLVKKHNYKKLVTTTTRGPRINEVDGKDYHFLTKQEFEEKLANNEFVEHTIYQNNYYGIQKKDVTDNAVVVVDPKGANVLYKKLKTKLFICLIDAKKDVRKDRMLKRNDHPLDIKRRLKSDDKIFRKTNLDNIDLLIKIDDQRIENIADLIHNNYLNFLKKRG